MKVQRLTVGENTSGIISLEIKPRFFFIKPRLIKDKITEA